MRLVSFLHDGQIRLGAVRKDGSRELVFDLNQIEPRLPADMTAFLESGASARSLAVQALAHAPVGVGTALDAVILKAPIPRPGKILAVGQNYVSHVAETIKKVAPQYPVIFPKFSNTVIGHREAIVLPKVSLEPDYEGEMGIIISKRCRHVPLDEALGCVGGYTILNDVSARDYQRRTTQWTMGKCFDTFCPMGPVLVTADEIPDPQNLNLRLSIGSEVLQNANTSDMIFPVAKLIESITEVMTLEPGDVIATGTPGGVGFSYKPPRWLRPGDVVRVEIERIGVLENPVVAEA